MNKFILLALITGCFSVNALECPQSIKVVVKGLKSTSANNEAAIENIYKKGDSQTSKNYIKAVLNSVNSINDHMDILNLNKKQTSDSQKCTYQGKASRLTIGAKSWGGETAKAELFLGRVNYRSSDNENPVSSRGYVARLETALSQFDAAHVSPVKNQNLNLLLDLVVQIPMGDYGTDGYEKAALIGRASGISYEVVK